MTIVVPGTAPPITVVLDPTDDPTATQAALDAHAPRLGQVTVHPTPASGAPAALAQDVLHALGKHLPQAQPGDGSWADAIRPAWLAAGSWILAGHIHSLTVTRTHQLTPTRLQQLLDLREQTGIQLTLLWHTRRTTPLHQALDGLPHHYTDRLPTPAGKPAWAGTSSYQWPADPALVDDGSWITPIPGPSTPVQRSPRTPCPGADTRVGQLLRQLPRTDNPNADQALLAHRLHTRIAHPIHAAALAAAAITGADTRRLAHIRQADLASDTTAIKTHGRTTASHRTCRLHPVPAWARPLLHAARAWHHLNHHPPSGNLLPGLALPAGDLTALAAHCHLHLQLGNPTPARVNNQANQPRPGASYRSSTK